MEHTMCSESSSSLHSIQHSCCTTKGAMSRSPTKWYLYLWPFCHLLHWVRAQQSYCSTAAAYGHPSLAHSPPFMSRLWIQNLGRVRPRSHRSGPDSRTCLRHCIYKHRSSKKAWQRRRLTIVLFENCGVVTHSTATVLPGLWFSWSIGPCLNCYCTLWGVVWALCLHNVHQNW